MKYTNKFSLPEYVTSWLEWDSYDYEDNVISATRLLSPPRQYALYLWHKDELETEVSDLIAGSYGTAIHDSIEQVKVPNILKELRLYADINLDGKIYRISGKFDMMIDLDKSIQRLVDIKSTSVWAYIFNNKDKEYIKQLSIYRYLANHDGTFNVSRDAEIMMVFTDWSKSRALKDVNYPPIRICIKKIKLWSMQETEEYIKARLRLFKKAKESTTETLIPCSQEELWQDDDKWAVMQEGKVRALKLCDTEKDGRIFILSNNLNTNAYLLFKPGIAKRCNYCLARNFCSQYKELKDSGKTNEIEHKLINAQRGCIKR